MTSGVEQLGLSSRPLSGLLVNQPPIQITEAIAKELQLRDGQIVKALVEDGGKHLLLSANERSFRLPVASIYSAGATLSLRYASSIYGRHLLPSSQSIPSESTISSSSKSTPSTVPPALVSFALSYVGKINRGTLGALDLTSVLGAFGFAALVERIRESNTSIRTILQKLPSKSLITPRVVAEALLHSGLFSESMFADKSRGRLDLKQTLTLLREISAQDIDQISRIAGAIDRVELSQIEALIAQDRREALYKFVIPFQDGSCVYVEIEGRKKDHNTEDRSWSVSLDTQDPDLGYISVKASLLEQAGIEIIFWADRPGTVSLMKNMLPELAHELEGYGASLSSANVISGKRMREEPSEFNDGQGSFLDLQT